MGEQVLYNPYGYIYITTNWINGKKYVGQRSFTRHWENYLGSGKMLKYAIQKYGAENFTSSIIDIAYSKDELNRKEIQWISDLCACESISYYNLTHGGDGGNTICNYTEEERIQLSKNHSEAIKNSSNKIIGDKSKSATLTNQQASEIIQKLLDGAYNSDLQKEYGVTRSCISGIRNHKTWKHLTDGLVFPRVRKYHPVNKRVSRYTTQGEYIDSFSSAREASKAVGVSYKKISQCCTQECVSTGGYLWCFDGDLDTIRNAVQRYNTPTWKYRQKAIHAKCISTGVVYTFDCVNDAISELRINRCIETIRRAAKANTECAGYIWKYAEVQS